MEPFRVTMHAFERANARTVKEELDRVELEAICDVCGEVVDLDTTEFDYTPGNAFCGCADWSGESCEGTLWIREVGKE